MSPAVMARIDVSGLEVTKALYEAANALDSKLTLVEGDPAYQAVWALAQIHNGPYMGPQYGAERLALREALKAFREAAS